MSDSEIAAIAAATGETVEVVQAVLQAREQLHAGPPIGTTRLNTATGELARWAPTTPGGVPVWRITPVDGSDPTDHHPVELPAGTWVELKAAQ